MRTDFIVTSSIAFCGSIVGQLLLIYYYYYYYY